ncbi:hypothetical protein KK060_13920 [Fulvivirgaceae bacterium PWU20]|uniref:Uncharacterized protein n=1 Tax=Chryseosolibacter indicus TaxID=2782351 RepID=A0ABS5VSJ2_9BACT|nr:hypothetical protein [Chryseosolibacter indicus]
MPAPCVQRVCEKWGYFLADMVLAWCSHGAGIIHSQAILFDIKMNHKLGMGRIRKDAFYHRGGADTCIGATFPALFYS